jgi:glutamate synthase domain-containing protein 2
MAAAVFSNFSRKLADDEKHHDRSNICDTEQPRLSDDFYEKFSSHFISRIEFETYYKEFSRIFQQLKNENEEIRRKNSYLESIVMESFFENVNKASHENSTILREHLQLPALSEKANKSVIFELDSILEDMGNSKKSSTELLRDIRGR